MYEHILVAFDGSAQSRAALRHVLANFPEADIHAVSVIDPQEFVSVDEFGGLYTEDMIEAARESAESDLSTASELAAAEGVTLTTALEMGRPAATIVEYAEDHDLEHIFVGSHGRRGLSRFLLGSVAETVARRAPVPVTIVRESDEEGETEE